jgi:integrase
MAKQSDGRYRAKVTVGRADGKSIVKYVSGRTRKELEAAKEAVKQEYITGRSTPENAVFGAYAVQWYEIYKKPNIGASAQSSYKTTLNLHILPVLGNKRLTAISTMDLQELINSKADTCATIIENVFHILESVFKQAYSEGIIQRDITVGLIKPSKEKSSRRALTEAEEEAAKKLMQEENGLLVALLYYTGMRLGEALGLQWECIDFKKKVIHVRQQVNLRKGTITPPKTKESIRDIPLPDELAEMLVRGFPQAFVFPAPDGTYYRNSSSNRLWRSLMERMAELEPSIETREDGASVLTPHYFRHNYASILYNAGVDVLSAQKFLGHANVKVTLEIYSHLSKEKEDASAGAVIDAFKKRLPESCQNKNTK